VIYILGCVASFQVKQVKTSDFFFVTISLGVLAFSLSTNGKRIGAQDWKRRENLMQKRFTRARKRRKILMRD